MVDISKIKNPGKTQLCACRIGEKYIEALKADGVSFTDFVRQAFRETYPEIEQLEIK